MKPTYNVPRRPDNPLFAPPGALPPESYSPENNLPYQAGAWLRDYLRKPGIMSAATDKGPLTGGAAYGAAGAGLGALLSLLTGGNVDTGRAAALGGVAGAGLGAGLGMLKRGSLLSQDPRGEVARRLQMASGLDWSQKRRMLDVLDELSWQQAEEIRRGIIGVSGAAVGALVARYLLGWGLLGTVVGGAVGAAVGNYMSTPRNAFGEAVHQPPYHDWRAISPLGV